MTERFTPEDAYRLHIERIEGERSRPTVPFEELSDLAIQMYAEDASMLNEQADSAVPEIDE